MSSGGEEYVEVEVRWVDVESMEGEMRQHHVVIDRHTFL